MPYINPQRKSELAAAGHGASETPGELNYLITMLVEDYRAYHGNSYTTFNDIVGALDNAKDEFRRRVQHPYEDRKCEENGDVYASV